MKALETIKETAKRFTLPDYIKPCVALMLSDKLAEGRDRVAFIIATELRRTGKEPDVAEKILNRWDQNNTPPLGSRTIHNKIRSAYNKEYAFGCNSEEPVMYEYCKKINKDFCPYHKELLQGKKRIGSNRDFIRYGWPKILKPSARQIYFMAIPELEKRRGIKPGQTLFASHREIHGVCGVTTPYIGEGLRELRERGLITYKPGKPYRWRVEASEIKRIIPIPKPEG